MKLPQFGSVIATIGLDRGQARELLLAIEAAMRAGLSSPQLQSWRIQLLNLRWRAHLGEWTGWQQ